MNRKAKNKQAREVESLAFEKTKAEAQNLVSADGYVNRVCAALVAARQLYSLAGYSLHAYLQTTDYSDEVEMYLVNSMAEYSNTPFRRDHLLNSLNSLVVPFLEDEIKTELSGIEVVEESAIVSSEEAPSTTDTELQ